MNSASKQIVHVRNKQTVDMLSNDDQGLGIYFPLPNGDFYIFFPSASGPNCLFPKYILHQQLILTKHHTKERENFGCLDLNFRSPGHKNKTVQK